MSVYILPAQQPSGNPGEPISGYPTRRVFQLLRRGLRLKDATVFEPVYTSISVSTRTLSGHHYTQSNLVQGFSLKVHSLLIPDRHPHTSHNTLTSRTRRSVSDRAETKSSCISPPCGGPRPLLCWHPLTGAAVRLTTLLEGTGVCSLYVPSFRSLLRPDNRDDTRRHLASYVSSRYKRKAQHFLESSDPRFHNSVSPIAHRSTEMNVWTCTNNRIE